MHRHLIGVFELVRPAPFDAKANL